MDCREWEKLLDDLLEARLPAARRAAAQAHAAQCVRCGGLLAAARSARAELVPPAGEDLTAAILARTSGAACGRARALLGDLTDGAVTSMDAGLLGQHLEHCASCRALARTLAWLVPQLGAMAEFDPGPEFTAAVLRATTGARRAQEQARLSAWGSGRAARAAGKAAGWLTGRQERLGAWWRAQLTRPQFAWEAAYAGTLLLILLCGTPLSPLREAPTRALSAVQATPAGLATAAVDLLGSLPRDVARAGGQALDRLAGPLGERARDSGARLDQRRERAAPHWKAARHDVRALGSAMLRLEPVAAAAHFSDLRADLERAWRAWRGQAALPAPARAPTSSNAT